MSNQSPYIDAADFGFSTSATGLANARALQQAVDGGGTIAVTRQGTYDIAAAVLLPSHTHRIFGPGVILRKVDEAGPFAQVFLDRGALTRTFDRDITIEGLHLLVNGVDHNGWKVFGLRGQVSFFYVRDLRIRRFRCTDLGRVQYCIHVCTFEDILVEDVFIEGEKDGVHLGRGKRLSIRDGVFKTFDDAVALNAHDYDTGNPELGWIESGIVENCHDLNADKTTGYFARILAGAWIDWTPGMQVQKSDTVVCHGRLYRVKAEPDGLRFTSNTRPSHETGTAVLDGITWAMVQSDVTHTAGVRDVTFREITLDKPRVGFSIHFDDDRYSRSYYPGAIIPCKERLTFENIRVRHAGSEPLPNIATPVDYILIANSFLGHTTVRCHGHAEHFANVTADLAIRIEHVLQPQGSDLRTRCANQCDAVTRLIDDTLQLVTPS